MSSRLFVLVVFIAVFCLTAVATAQEFVTDGLIAFWTLDKATVAGGKVKDTFGETDGTIEGDVVTVKGVINEGMEFDGAGARVEVPKTLMVGLESFTIECWFNYVDSANWRWMFGGGPEWNYGLGCCIYSGSIIVRYHLKTDGGSFYDGNGMTMLKPGEWFHIVYTYDGKTAISYVNGELDFQRPIAGAVMIDPTTLAIGAGYWQNNEYFKGVLDEVRVYDRALSENEANKNYKAKSNSLSVGSAGKLCETWGNIKSM